MQDTHSPDGPSQASPVAVNRCRRAWLGFIGEDPYWKKVWVFQEVACARNSSVVYRAVEDDLEAFLDGMSQAVRLWFLINDQSRDLDEVKHSWPNMLLDLRSSITAARHLNLKDLMTKTSQGRCNRPVDRAYGLPGLAVRLDPEFDVQDLAMDYGKDLNDMHWDILFTVLNAPENNVFQVRDATWNVNMALRRGAYEETPPFDGNTFKKLSLKGQKRAQLVCTIACVSVEEHRHAKLVPSELKAAGKQACSHRQQLSCYAEEDTLRALRLLASLKTADLVHDGCSAARLSPVAGISWLGAAHMMNGKGT